MADIHTLELPSPQQQPGGRKQDHHYRDHREFEDPLTTLDLNQRPLDLSLRFEGTSPAELQPKTTVTTLVPSSIDLRAAKGKGVGAAASRLQSLSLSPAGSHPSSASTASQKRSHLRSASDTLKQLARGLRKPKEPPPPPVPSVQLPRASDDRSIRLPRASADDLSSRFGSTTASRSLSLSRLGFRKPSLRRKPKWSQMETTFSLERGGWDEGLEQRGGSYDSGLDDAFLRVPQRPQALRHSTSTASSFTGSLISDPPETACFVEAERPTRAAARTIRLPGSSASSHTLRETPSTSSLSMSTTTAEMMGFDVDARPTGVVKGVEGEGDSEMEWLQGAGTRSIGIHHQRDAPADHDDRRKFRRAGWSEPPPSMSSTATLDLLQEWQSQPPHQRPSGSSLPPNQPALPLGRRSPLKLSSSTSREGLKKGKEEKEKTTTTKNKNRIDPSTWTAISINASGEMKRVRRECDQVRRKGRGANDDLVDLLPAAASGRGHDEASSAARPLSEQYDDDADTTLPHSVPAVDGDRAARPRSASHGTAASGTSAGYVSCKEDGDGQG
jgi:hypothetical protein